jgi:hypothetical protein
MTKCLLALTLPPSRTGAFDWTTDDPHNSYVDAQGLHIVPTLTLDTTDITPGQMMDGYAFIPLCPLFR